MRAAKAMSEKEPAHNPSAGTVEEKVGSAVGCEGMVEEVIWWKLGEGRCGAGGVIPNAGGMLGTKSLGFL